MISKLGAGRNAVRVIGGSLRSRKINFPEVEGLRPTSDRIRETLFNWIQNDTAGAHCLDLFAGCGALGIEALSRGASQVTMIDSHQLVIDALKHNCELLKLSNFTVKKMDAQSWIEQYGSEFKFDLIFLDPPFQDDSIVDICHRLNSVECLQQGCKIYLEAGREVEESQMPAEWEIIKRKKSGQVWYALYKYSKVDN